MNGFLSRQVYSFPQSFRFIVLDEYGHPLTRGPFPAPMNYEYPTRLEMNWAILL
jgi:hypothetical protein